ncbi:uncharacterized protein Z519_01477 [Cladophialophora bantiana CBS 173.52]|uniref:Uncharacterized protein n=1 Tax=Cladophialophora bantiana (strain ATCC 10958 / CBS 173.52 / CDC B-1940 / NIH 8579) TaxID=1442370 RepID=A0A0D2HWY5_CLAB1|nr:uncharacterized protein Z519_01477 [Cladophialophora bantiana CBS 173.52]KIW97893.1 hypothetical protein Z519_01477 [Cladophialophora bantiana CBS 173.52]
MPKAEGDTEFSQIECHDHALSGVAPDGNVELPDKGVEVPVAGTPLAPNLVPLMELERGVVGWDSVDDPTNPK